MYTQCPECESAFRVSADVLKQAAGMVRCGSCGHAFNSLEYLSEQKPGVTRPDPSIPELKPEPQEAETTGGAPKAPRSISAEQSAALLKTLDQLAGEDIRIEDTGVEWRVLGADEEESDEGDTAFDPSQTDVSHLDADTEIDFSDSEDDVEGLVESENTGIWIVGDSMDLPPEETAVFEDPTQTVVDESSLFDSGSTRVDELLDEAATPVDEVLEAGGTSTENAELFETQMMGTASVGENAELFQTQMMGTVAMEEHAELFQTQQIEPSAPAEKPPEAEAPAEQMRFDDNTPLPDDFLDEPSPPQEATAPVPVEEDHSSTYAEPQTPIALSEPDEWEQLLDEFDDLLATDLDTESTVNGSAEAKADESHDTSIEDDLISAAFENDEPDAGLGTDLDASIEEDLMTAAFEIEEANDAEARDEEDVDETEPAEFAEDESEAEDEAIDEVDADSQHEPVEAQTSDDADPAPDEESIEVDAQADEVDNHLSEANAELGDVLDEASRLAESLDDESGRFNLDDEEDDGVELDTDRRAENVGDESIAEELLALDIDSSAETADSEEDHGEPEEVELAAGDEEDAAEDLSADDEEQVSEDDEEPSEPEHDDESSEDDEKLDLESVLDPDDEGLIDEGESDPDRDDDDLPELHDVGDRPASEHHVPPMSEEEETINMMIDQDLLAIAQVDDEGFTSTIIVEEGVAPVKVKTESVIIGDPDDDEKADMDRKVEEALQLKHESSGIFGLGIAKTADADSEPSRGRTMMIAAALGFLALGLAGQYVHQNRESLATNPTVAGILNPVYEQVGMPITPDWDVSGWDIARTQGGTDEQDQLLTIFSEIRNTSETALPYPIVTLSLTDRYQDSIGALILEPGDYLAAGNNVNELVPPGGKFEAVIPIDEPSAQAIGYTINACYRTPSSDLRCAVSDFK